VKIGIVGKYVEFPDAYKSLNEALMHGGIANDAAVELEYIVAEAMESGHWPREIHDVDGILVPIGFGVRGAEGKMRGIRYARERKVPFFGICLGMQCLVIEFARNVCGLAEANSTEFAPEAAENVIYKLRDLLGVEEMGGTMRLGAYPCRLKPGSLAHRIYGSDTVSERHRHRYEVNQRYLKPLTEHGLVISGLSPDGKFVEIVEYPEHPWFLGCQFHPEYKSKPTAPHPLFVSFIHAALEHQERRQVAESRPAGEPEIQARPAAPAPEPVGVGRPWRWRTASGTWPTGWAWIWFSSRRSTRPTAARSTATGGPVSSAGWRSFAASRPRPACPCSPTSTSRTSAGRRPRSATCSRYRPSSAVRPIWCSPPPRPDAR
jgi:gamma-glutamyl-gamma-aminobutyrate hydrolase PuuD